MDTNGNVNQPGNNDGNHARVDDVDELLSGHSGRRCGCLLNVEWCCIHAKEL